MTPIETAESWSAAKETALTLGPPPSTFYTCVRFLRNDTEQNDGRISPVTKACLLRLLNSPSLQAPLYYAAITYRPNKLPSNTTLSLDTLIQVFRADEIANIISLLYVSRSLRRDCDAEEWKHWCSTVHPLADLGGFFGEMVPPVGMATGILAGCGRFLGSAMFLKVDKARYIKYRRNCKTKKLFYDLNEEMKLWGCTHVQISSVLLQSMGLGVEFPYALARALLPQTNKDELPSHIQAIKTASLWAESLSSTGKPPDIVHRAEFHPSESDLDRIVSIAQEIRDKGSKYEWLSKGKGDLGEGKTPSISKEGGPTAIVTTQSTQTEIVEMNPPEVTAPPEEAVAQAAEENTKTVA